jgi:adenosylcobinamide-phosphate synthase
MTALIIFFGYLLDGMLGDPQSWPHPVRLIGKLISFFERLVRRSLELSKAQKRGFLLGGAVMGLCVIALSGFSIWAILSVANQLSPVLWFIAALYLTYTIFCLNDLLKHVRNVENALERFELAEARAALSWIVGRDTAGLDSQAIRRASIETLAENFSDGLVAPLFYLAVGGPVLAWVYKAINTLDSMVGYKNDRFIYLGRFCAYLDDLVNYLPSRLAALVLVLAARIHKLDHRKSFETFRKEGRFHSSPNSGQTEAAMAGALDVFLGGSSTYGGMVVDKPKINRLGGAGTKEAVSLAIRLVKTGTILILTLAMTAALLASFFFVVPWGWGLKFF